jgi:hypothetical protein
MVCIAITDRLQQAFIEQISFAQKPSVLEDVWIESSGPSVVMPFFLLAVWTSRPACDGPFA